jgi:hypothetical protein
MKVFVVLEHHIECPFSMDFVGVFKTLEKAKQVASERGGRVIEEIELKD